jgi:hypothetical protein
VLEQRFRKGDVFRRMFERVVEARIAAVWLAAKACVVRA